MDTIIGRKEEITRLDKVFKSKEAEFVVLHGRRRVGKTYLIREFFKEKDCIYFQSTGLQKGRLSKQLEHFSDSIVESFIRGINIIKTPSSWEEAFKILTQLMNNDKSQKKIVIFLDELPWMATRKSGLLEALDYYWNRYWSTNSRIILIVCGSSASWLIRNIIYNQGGLHNRCTCELKLNPFNLQETNAFLNYKGIKLNKNHILEIYMALGGIPYYLRYIDKGLTAAENIQNILFSEKAPLKDEFKKLFISLFRSASAYIELIKIISEKKDGVSRAYLESKAQLSSGGRLTDRLEQLIHTNFIEPFVPYEKERGEYYKVIDEFSLFYMHWFTSKSRKYTEDHWLKQIQKPSYQAWAGYAFEAVCHKHISKIITALNIKNAESVSAWRTTAKHESLDGAQIDLLIDRSDDAITICEIKYTDIPFAINKGYAENLNKKIAVFKTITKTQKQIFLAMISANGLKPTMYSEEMVSGVVTLADLF